MTATTTPPAPAAAPPTPGTSRPAAGRDPGSDRAFTKALTDVLTDTSDAATPPSGGPAVADGPPTRSEQSANPAGGDGSSAVPTGAVAGAVAPLPVVAGGAHSVTAPTDAKPAHPAGSAAPVLASTSPVVPSAQPAPAGAGASPEPTEPGTGTASGGDAGLDGAAGPTATGRHGAHGPTAHEPTAHEPTGRAAAPGAPGTANAAAGTTAKAAPGATGAPGTAHVPGGAPETANAAAGATPSPTTATSPTSPTTATPATDAATAAGPAGTDPGATLTAGAPAPAAPATASAPAPAAAPAGAAPAGTAPAPLPMTQQLATHLATLRAAPDGAYSMVVRVDPDDLGPVTISVRLHDGDLQVSLTSGLEQARDLMVKALPDLRRDLQQAGLSCSQLRIEAEPDPGSSAARHDTQPGRDGQHPPQHRHTRTWLASADQNTRGVPVGVSNQFASSGVDVRV